MSLTQSWFGEVTDQSLRQIPVFVETVVAVGRAVALHGLEHQM
jgi:hypothetical protein